VIRAGKTYYAYGTYVRWDGRLKLFPIVRSRDLVHWRYVGDAFARRPGWTRDRLWAPSALHRGGQTYLFYSARARTGRHCVAVATARRLAGPFEHRAVLACGRSLGYIDPFPFTDPSGRTWLYLARADPSCSAAKQSCFISAYPLSRSLLRTEGPRRLILGVSQPWETRPGYQTVENPFVLHYGGLYYLLYSANDWRTAEYAMGYAVSSSPLGPFVKAGGPLVSKAPGVTGPGGGSVVIGPSGGHWLVYHARRTGFEHSGERTLHIDPLIVGNGAISTSGPTPGLALLP
jgi:beta-xylosidase